MASKKNINNRLIIIIGVISVIALITSIVSLTDTKSNETALSGEAINFGEDQKLQKIKSGRDTEIGGAKLSAADLEEMIKIECPYRDGETAVIDYSYYLHSFLSQIYTGEHDIEKDFKEAFGDWDPTSFMIAVDKFEFDTGYHDAGKIHCRYPETLNPGLILSIELLLSEKGADKPCQEPENGLFYCKKK